MGYGGVGKAFLGVLKDALPALNAGGIDLKVVGAATTSKLVFDQAGINYEEDLSSHFEKNPGFEGILQRLKNEDPQNLIAVDLTSAETGKFFAELLANGIHVVTANKRPLAGAKGEFENIKKYCNGSSPSLRYEATVGGGLPIISTIIRLRRSGDEVIDIRGILSGTLGFIMDEVSNGKPFSEAVREAHSLGYTEPDPRDDLSGADVRRKALILSRTLGGNLEPEQILGQSLVPDELRSVEVAEFLKSIRGEDAKYRRVERMAYVATVTSLGATLGVEPLSSGDPLATLNGPENMVAIRTKKYFRNPLVIRGPGAGVVVTAQGVMGDVLRILGIL